MGFEVWNILLATRWKSQIQLSNLELSSFQSGKLQICHYRILIY